MTDMLARIDDLLWEQDDVLIDRALETGEAPRHGVLGEQECSWCGHDWHGLRCDLDEDCDWGCGDCGDDCGCESSLTPHDDTWRPVLGWGGAVTRHMADTGLDGWAAKADLSRPWAKAAVGGKITAGMITADLIVSGSIYTRPVEDPESRVLTPAGWTQVGLLDRADGVTVGRHIADEEIEATWRSPNPVRPAHLGTITTSWRSTP